MLEFEVIADDFNIILLYGKNEDFGLMQMHYAFNAVGSFLRHTEKYSDFLMTFVDEKISESLKPEGFGIFGVWRDCFNNDISSYSAPDGIEYLKESDYKKASEIILACKNQSRGFMGQTAEWIADWAAGKEGISDTNILAHYEGGEPVGIVCVGIYGHESEKGAVLWVRELVVHPKYQRRGIAEKLLRQALGYGAMLGAKRAFLAVDDDNCGAIKLYKKMGFERKMDECEIAMYKPK